MCVVSIPKRVSEALKLWKELGDRAESYVSIPKRVSEALKQRVASNAMGN